MTFVYFIVTHQRRVAGMLDFYFTLSCLKKQVKGDFLCKSYNILKRTSVIKANIDKNNENKKNINI